MRLGLQRPDCGGLVQLSTRLSRAYSIETCLISHVQDSCSTHSKTKSKISLPFDYALYSNVTVIFFPQCQQSA